MPIQSLKRACVVAFATALLALPAGAAEIVQVRIGNHPTFTRVVFQLDSPAGYRIERRVAEGGGHEILVTLEAGSGPRSLVSESVMVERVAVQDGRERATAHLRLKKPPSRVKELILADPPRLVFDLVFPEAELAAAKRRAERVAAPKAEPAQPSAAVEKPEASPERSVVVSPTPVPVPRQLARAEPAPTPAPADPPAPKPLAKPEPAPKPVTKPEPVTVATPEPVKPVTVAGRPAAKSAPPAAAQPPPVIAVEPEAARPVPRPTQRPVAKPAPEAGPAAPKSQQTPPKSQEPTPKSPESKPAAASSGGASLLLLGGAAAGVLLVGIALLLWLRRRSLPNDMDVTALLDEADAAEPESSGASRLEQRLGQGPTSQPVIPELREPEAPRRDAPMPELAKPAAPSPPLPRGDTGIAAGPGLFEDDLEKEREPMDSESPDLPMDRTASELPTQLGNAVPAAGGGDVARLMRDLERRVAQLETRLDESVDARERLERQAAAQAEELRVQRAAIARTQRALRSLSRGDEEQATEPALREPARQ